MRISALFCISLLLWSCSSNPTNVENNLRLAGSNKTELESVITHYRSLGDKEKLNAAYFLIGNMKDKYSKKGEIIQNFDTIFHILNDYHKTKQHIYMNSPLLSAQWDSLVNKYGNPAMEETEQECDLNYIKAEVLIDNIDQAFLMYRTSKWCKGITFKQFCEFVLPYRTGTERLEIWRNKAFNDYKSIFDTLRNRNVPDALKDANTVLKGIFDTNNIMRRYPFDMTPSSMMLGRRGSCKQVVAFTADLLRAQGIPTAIDYVELWGDRSGNHFWNTVLIGGGKIIPFEAASKGFRFKTPYRFSKVYRRTFEIQEIEQPEFSTSVPKGLLDAYRLDVTDQYTLTYEVKVPILYPMESAKTNVLLCTYADDKWNAQEWGVIRDNFAYFKKIGSNLVYLPMYYSGGKYIPLGNPFILTSKGKVQDLFPSKNKKETITVFRKYPNWPANINNMKETVGSRLQGANRADFKDSVNLFEVVQQPFKFEEGIIEYSQSFRYVRLIGPTGKNATVAELEFFSNDPTGGKLSGKIIGFPEVDPNKGTAYQFAFDNDLGTYFSGNKDGIGWVGLDLGKPKAIGKFRYCPRSDTNFIIVGDWYELSFWEHNRWTSLGKQKAANQQLTFTNVPSNSLLILNNLSHGKENRIFTYENGKQVWW